MELVRAGKSKSAALRIAIPDRPVSSELRRLRRYEYQGRDGLIDRHLPVCPPRKMDAEARGALRALAVVEPKAGSVVLAERLSELMGRSFGPTTVQVALRSLGLARGRGRPVSSGLQSVVEKAVVTPLPLAGCELLKAIDEEIGAVHALTRAIDTHLLDLPQPVGPVVDDSGARDERGRFLPAYNAASPRTAAELGGRFDTVEKRRREKNLPAMRIVRESEETHHRKNLALTLLPVVVRGTRWSALNHWRGDHLGELVGFAYQASTLDKYLREMKFSGANTPMREAVVSFWTTREGPVQDKQTGAVLLYIDAKTKPLWTRHWTRSTKVSETGRVMPAVTTMTLHSGAGTPLVYRSWSGHVSLPAQAMDFLDAYEKHAGEETARRVVVMDREAHAIWLFKEMAARNRMYIVPLRSQVVGPNARFEEVGPWTPFIEGPDEVCDGFLWLNDRRKGEKALRVRVVGRKRHRTGKVAWYATNTPVDGFSSSDVVRLYFERWPAQEHVYRNGSGAVGLNTHHGYGKKKVHDVAILDKLDKLEGRVRRLTLAKEKHFQDQMKTQEELTDWKSVITNLGPEVTPRRTALDAALRSGETGDAIADSFATYETMEKWLSESRAECLALEESLSVASKAVAVCDERLASLNQERERWERRREIFTVDVELDEVMTAFKLTFMNLCAVFMQTYLGTTMELETLIEAVLTLPGERITTSDVETVRIFRPARDSNTIEAVQRACEKLTDLGLSRGTRTLRFDVADHASRTADPLTPPLGGQ